MLRLTDRAVERIARVIADHGGAFYGLRVGLQDGGCSGYTYLIAFEREKDDDDLVIEERGARVLVHPLHLPYLAGSSVDWKDGTLQSGFTLENPNVKRTCGCGESFDV